MCKTMGLSGHQGVLIPSLNAKDLMLQDDIVKAVSEGLFHIYSVETVDQGLELLSGIAAKSNPSAKNDCAARGSFAYDRGSFHSLVDDRLREFEEMIKQTNHTSEHKKVARL